MDSVQLGAQQIKAIAFALILIQARLLPLFLLLPFMARAMVPRTVAMAFAGGIGIVLLPTLWQAGKVPVDGLFLVMICKEAVIGLILGFLVALPFWMIESVGFVIDNQRGASMAAMVNPLSGTDTSPLGLMLNLAFICFFMVSGGMNLLLGLIYDSYRVWDPVTFWPTLGEDFGALMVVQLNRLMMAVMLFAAPAIVAMLLAELGLALVSRFAPQLQVFFLAMPIKSALGVFVLIVYAGTLFEGMRGPMHEVGSWVRQLDAVMAVKVAR